MCPKLLNLCEPQPPHLTKVGNDTLQGARRNLVRQNTGLALASSEAPLVLESGYETARGGVSRGGFRLSDADPEASQGLTEHRKPSTVGFVDWKEQNTRISRK